MSRQENAIKKILSLREIEFYIGQCEKAMRTEKERANLRPDISAIRLQFCDEKMLKDIKYKYKT